MRTFLFPAFLFCLFVFSGCATPGAGDDVAGKAAQFSNSAAGQALANTLINVALDGATQYASGEKINRRQLVANTLDGAAQNIRSLVNTSQASSLPAIRSAAADGINVRAISQQLAPMVAAHVTQRIDFGAPPNQAIEDLATVMNTAAAKARTGNLSTVNDGP